MWFRRFKKKIRYLVIKKFPNVNNSWERENYNRNYLVNGLYDAKPNDYIMISDLDEIPKITNKKIFQESHSKQVNFPLLLGRHLEFL